MRHLFQTGEVLGQELATLHSLHFYLTTMRRLREAIEGGRFAGEARAFLEDFRSGTAAEAP
jgi:queuine tRNA-ribosyltransferase